MRPPTPEQIAHWGWLAKVTDLDVDRFLSKIVLGDPPRHLPDDGPCHMWIAGISRGGQTEEDGREKLPYGSFWVAGSARRAHIFSALCIGTFENKPHVPGLVVDHRCRRTLCVAPRHLEPVPVEENANRWRR